MVRILVMWWLALALAIAAGVTRPAAALAAGEINYSVVAAMSYGSDPSVHANDHGVMGDVYHYGTFPYYSHVVRSLYIQSLRDYLWTYIEVGQVHYAGFWTPTKHFYAYEDLGITSGQRLFTYGNCSKSTWYTYCADSNYPTQNSWKVGRTGYTFVSSLSVHTNGGVAKAAMERSSASDDGHGSYHNLKYKGPGPTVWSPWNSSLSYADRDYAYKAVTRSNSSFYTTSQ